MHSFQKGSSLGKSDRLSVRSLGVGWTTTFCSLGALDDVWGLLGKSMCKTPLVICKSSFILLLSFNNWGGFT